MLEVHLLGRFEILLDGQPLALPARPAQALLAYLVLHPAIPHRREQLAGLLWPDSDETNARRYLSQALWRLRKSLGEPYFHTDKLTLTFTPHPDDRLDVRLLAQPAAHVPDAWMDSLAVYQGRLLPGFYEDWAWEQAEHFQALFERQAQTLLDWLVKEHRWKDVLEWGEHWLRWGETPEPAYRALMQAHAGLGDQVGVAAVYRRCVTALDRDIGVEPSPETTTLYEQIRKGELKVDTSQPVQGLPTLPAFMTWDKPPPIPQPVFVARERVLEKLEDYLAQALDGRGQVAFVVGEAGQGKTSLLNEFLHRVQKTHPEILTAFGTCNAYAGTGDPYLPFRELMQMLTGDVEPQWRVGQFPTAQARLLWRTLPQTTEALLARGQNLIGTLVPGPSLLARAKAAGTENRVITQLETLVARQTGMEGMQQDFLFEQTSNVLRQLAEVHPLILVLDDLQWADESSTALLFHLGRRLRESRILLLGAYRPEDVAHGHHGQPHPLQGVVRELQRLYGEIEVNLDEDSHAHPHRFVEAYLDTEPNRLGADFRQSFVHHTGGHPLFTVETLRDMQARGDIWQDESGQWVAGPELSWEALSARVEGVIENRIARLSAEARRLLAIASVEGEVFTAEVIGLVKQRDPRSLVEALSGPLARQHCLVREQGMLRLEGETPQRLSQYRFQHHLFQNYLYNQLGEAERAYLHQDVGQALENLYEGRTAEVAVQLARHFREAGQVDKEIHYLRQAGERAAAQFAHEEAIAHFSRAFELLPEGEAAKRYELLFAREKEYDVVAKREAQFQDLEKLYSLAEASGDYKKLAEVALRKAYYYQMISNFLEAIVSAKEVIKISRHLLLIFLAAEGYFLWGICLKRNGDPENGLLRLQKALTLSRESDNHLIEIQALRVIGDYFAFDKSEYAKATEYFENSLQLAQKIGDKRGEGWARNNLGLTFNMLGDYQKAKVFCNSALLIFRQIGLRTGMCYSLENLSDMACQQGLYDNAMIMLREGLDISHEIKDSLSEASMLIVRGKLLYRLGDYAESKDNFEEGLGIFYRIGFRRGKNETAYLGLLYYQLGNLELARDYCEKAFLNADEMGSQSPQSVALTNLGWIFVGLKQFPEAVNAFQQALSIRTKLNQKNKRTEPLAGLAGIALAQKQLEEAQIYVQEILLHLQTGTLEGTYEPFRIYLTTYLVLQANHDPRAAALLETAHALLMQHAGNISDERLRTSFLENVRANRELVEAYRKRTLG